MPRRASTLALCLAFAACGNGSGSPAGPSDSLAVAPRGPFTPGTSYFGRSQYIEYIAGNLPIIFSAPGFRSVPSQVDVAPQMGEEHFSGGFNVGTWACAQSGTVCGVQIEAHSVGVRDTPASRAAFAAALVRVYVAFLRQNFALDIGVR